MDEPKENASHKFYSLRQETSINMLLTLCLIKRTKRSAPSIYTDKVQ